MMACVDFVDSVGVSGPPAAAAFGWLSPRISFSVDNTEMDKPDHTDAAEISDTSSTNGAPDFEFCLSFPDDQMLPADELFYQGKLVPLQHTPAKPATATRICDVISESKAPHTDAITVSPKAPKCSSRWKELLGLKKKTQQENGKTQKPPKSFKQLFRGFEPRTSTSSDPSNQPLLGGHPHSHPRDSDVDSSARISVSSDLEELPPRLSFENVRPPPPRLNVRRSCHGSSAGGVCRRGRSPYRASTIEAKLPVRGSSVDSPRMNSSGKIIYHSLERSCSSPSTFNGGVRNKDYYSHRRAMERSYSANVRVTPVLNVPVCSLRASSSKSSSSSASSSNKGTMFGFFSATQKKDNPSASQISHNNKSSSATKTAQNGHFHNQNGHFVAQNVGGNGSNSGNCNVSQQQQQQQQR